MSPKPYFSGVSRRVLLSAFAALPVLSISASAQTAASGDMLPSWNEGATKQAILNFVAAVTREGSADFVPPAERIATFDNDGTLWVEHPMYTQLAFGLDRVKALAALHPEWKNTQPFKAALEGDMKTLAQSGEHGMAELVMATHAGMTTEEFQKIVIDWFATARHPRFKRPYTELSYQPMIELLGYLRANGFKTFIVSGGGIEFNASVDRAGLWRAPGTSRWIVDQDPVPDARWKTGAFPFAGTQFHRRQGWQAGRHQ
jgi:hypothetical protein